MKNMPVIDDTTFTCIVLAACVPVLSFVIYILYNLIGDFINDYIRSPEEDCNRGATVLEESPDMIAKYRAVKEKANERCDECPHCGKKKYVEPDFISSRSWIESKYGLIKSVEYRMHKDGYRCTSCGTRWESAPYYTSRRVFNNITFKYEDEKQNEGRTRHDKGY